MQALVRAGQDVKFRDWYAPLPSCLAESHNFSSPPSPAIAVPATFLSLPRLVDGQAEEYDYILRNVNGVATWFVSDHDGDFVKLESAIKDEEDRIAQEETEVA